MEAVDTLAALRRSDLAGARELRLPPGLTRLPDEIVGLADTLEVLDLGGAALEDLPSWLPRLRRLRALFGSGGRYGRLPPVLGECAELSQLHFRRAGLREVPAESLPPKLRWLTLTDNALAALPDEIGRRPHLQKLMLAGNRLRSLPESLAGAERLELLRLSVNALEAPPPWLADLPALAWLAWSANPFEPEPVAADAPLIPFEELAVGAMLGEGASGRVHAAEWRAPGRTARPVAVKLFKDAVTSDGLPAHEMAATLAAGDHPSLAGALGRTEGGPGGAHGLVMPLLPAHWRVLAGPPSAETCSRDVYAADLRLAPEAALRLVRDVAAAALHLHGRGLMHGDLYAHNILWNPADGRAVLTDFGAASVLPKDDLQRWTPLEVLAFGRLLGEVLDRVDAPVVVLRDLQTACVSARPSDRPSMAEAVGGLAGI